MKSALFGSLNEALKFEISWPVELKLRKTLFKDDFYEILLC